MKKRLLTLLCAVAAIVVAGCGGGSDDSTPKPSTAFKLRIVDLVPLTGDLSALGASGRKSADLAVQQIQGATRRLGSSQSVEIVHVDDPGDPAAAVAKTKEQLGSGDAACITGSWTTAPTLAVLNQVAIPQGILQISPAATVDELSVVSDGGLFDRTVLPDSKQGPALADAIEEDVGGADGRKVSVAFENNSYGKGLAGSFTRAWRAKRGVVLGPVPYEPQATSFDDLVKTIGSSNVDAYAVFAFAGGYQRLATALIRAGLWDADRTYVPDALAVRGLPGGAGAPLTEGLRGTAPGAPEGSPATEAFAALFRRAGGPPRQSFAAQQFDAVMLCYLAAVRAGRADGRAMASAVRQVSGPPGAKYSWQQLPQAVKAVEQGHDIDYQGASGPIDLDQAGDPTAGVYDLFRFRGGALQVYGQAPVGSASRP
jgi:branched-chain amino acid transport system substrate-binding protein